MNAHSTRISGKLNFKAMQQKSALGSASMPARAHQISGLDVSAAHKKISRASCLLPSRLVSSASCFFIEKQTKSNIWLQTHNQRPEGTSAGDVFRHCASRCSSLSGVICLLVSFELIEVVFARAICFSPASTCAFASLRGLSLLAVPIRLSKIQKRHFRTPCSGLQLVRQSSERLHDGRPLTCS